MTKATQERESRLTTVDGKLAVVVGDTVTKLAITLDGHTPDTVELDSHDDGPFGTILVDGHEIEVLPTTEVLE